MTISVHEAQIRTASVEIRTLSVSGKQVTLALFRQLLREPLYDDEMMTVNGIPWGTINYHPDRCADEGRHRHVVWQKGLELRRAHVPDPTPTPRWSSPRGGAYLEALIVEDGWEPEIPRYMISIHSGLCVPVPGWPEPIFASVSAEAKEVLTAVGWQQDLALKELRQKVQWTAAQTQELVLDDLNELNRKWQWRRECWAAFDLLPQLFIAA